MRTTTGAVTAPTAGLHFTPAVIEELKTKGASTDFVTPSCERRNFSAHQSIRSIGARDAQRTSIGATQHIGYAAKKNQFVIPVGTTSMRTLESLYWFGVKLLRDEHAEFDILQDDPYTISDPPPAKEALLAVREHMDRHRLKH